ncbi:MAG: hypothetical protein WD066_18040 [Planctomycetaceae bacterium]
MIGREDVEIQTFADGSTALEVCLRVLLDTWPDACVEDGETGARYRSTWDVPLGKTTELLVYQDERTAKKWDELGAAPELHDTMVHVLFDPGYVNVVVDDPGSEGMSCLLDAMQNALNQDMFAIRAQSGQVELAA